MSNVFLIADTHFGHQGVCDFKGPHGISPLRPWDTAAEMDEELVKRWNEVVRPCDKVYHLGDLTMSQKVLVGNEKLGIKPIMSRLNGTKVLIKGNHDIYPLKNYATHFKDIRAYHVVDKLIFSHIPVHPDSKGRFVGNVHGHLHARRVMKFASINDNTFGNIIDPFYYCVSVEHTDYRPVAYEEVKKYYRENVVGYGAVCDERANLIVD